MAEARIVNVYPHKVSTFRSVANQTLFWGFLIGAIAFNHNYLGDSWVISLAAFFMAFVILVAFGRKTAGVEVSLSHEQCVEWVRAGQPTNVKAWLDGRQ